MKLVVTIDVEEDNWGEFCTAGYSLENVKKIRKLQGIFDKYRVRPTYLVNYPVATDRCSIEMFREFLGAGKCEVGAHCHPWNTPPFEESLGEYNSMLCNLPDDLQYRKLASLKDAICNNLDVTPVSFRAGRWGFSRSIASALVKLGFKIDTSVTPYTDWSIYSGVDYRASTPDPYRFDADNIFRPANSGQLWQIPASIGFVQSHYKACNWLLRQAERAVLRKLRIKGILARLHLLNMVFLSPEVSSGKDMVRLARRMRSLGFTVLNLFFHSATLLPGRNPFTANEQDEQIFYQRLVDFFEFANASNIEPVLLRDVPDYLCLSKAGMASAELSAVDRGEREKRWSANKEIGRAGN
jgi:hypothetical protein